ncbi:hypothetical protein SSX86_025816 [Deinandra increscens subsp. villosa]|uniref:OCEL domain-containing protein n=1 Tax=Deinandra increscens subsp. villosa TaxID=3103831 RepID=A0AAP0CIH4_9ASTR
MYGGSGKLGRGRGGGPANRNIHSTFQPSSVQRPSANPGGGRQSAGGGHRSRSSTPAAPVAASTADETFSLVRNNPLNFGMIIRLTPVLVEEIKRLEAQGGAARMKFDPSANNPAGNVIDVGGKEFRFTWSQETGDLCDIYEERRSGDNGDGLLVECGGAWRKLNVQRELDETVKNHVKMRTVEAERKHKSRTAIVLDHGNPSMKTQMKALAAAEVNNAWKGSYKQQKKEPPLKKMKAEPSPAVVPPKFGGKAGFSSSTPSKIRASVSPLLSTPEQSGVPLSPLRHSNFNKVHTNRDDATLTQSSKGNARTVGVVPNKPGSNEISGNKPTDLQSLLISLLMEKPHGMNLKALEKAIGETFPKSVKQIEPVLKKIAVFQAPGRYILKPDVELESFKRSLSESGSSPENNNRLREVTPAPPASSFPLKVDDVNKFIEPSHQISERYEDLNTSEKIDIDNLSPDVLSDKKVSHNNEGPTISSSRSGSDSDSESDSSDSESESRSPVGSRSGSSSDSDSDASANSKQGSDEDVDIMSDDDKEPKQKLQPLDHELGYAHNMADEKDDGHGSDLVDIDLFEDNNEAGLHVADNNEDNYADQTTNLLINQLHNQEREVYDHAKKVVLKNKSDRESDEKQHFEENGHVKRLKSANWARPTVSRSPDGLGMINQAVDVPDYDFENVNNREFLGNYTSDSPRPGSGSIDLNAQAKPPADMDNIGRFSERGPQGNTVFSMQKDNKINKERRAEDGPSKDRRPPKTSGRKHSGSHQKKHGTSIEKIKEPELLSTSQIKDSPADLVKSTLINGCRPTLLRELSDLEMGEFRENMHEEKRFERNNSFKQSENISSSDYWNLDESKGKPNDMLNLPKKLVPEEHVDDFTRLNGKQLLPRLDHVKAGSQHSKGRHNEAGASTLNTDSQRKVNVEVPRKHEKQAGPISTKDKRKHKPKDLGEKKKDFWMVNSRDNNGQKVRELESCSDDSISSYTKYEKEEPEMKGPVRDLSQYNEYVQEYREKYDCYQTLNKILESYRNEFQTFGRDLELAKGRDNDRYTKVLEQLMKSYRQCGTKHKRLKKIFVVLHHELQHLKQMIRDFAEKQAKG